MKTIWSQCVDYGTKLQIDEHGIVEELKKVDIVDFRDFVKSWGTLKQRRAKREIQAVKSVLGIIQHLKTVWLHECNLGADHLRILCDVLDGVKFLADIHELRISWNDNIEAEGFRYLAIIAARSELKKLYVERCNLRAEGLERFIQGMDGVKIRELHVTDNLNIEGFGYLATIAAGSELKKLVVNNCNLTAEHLKEFDQGMDEVKIHELNIGCNPTIDPEGFSYLGIIAARSELKKLNVVHCDVTAEHLESFMHEMVRAQLEELIINSADLEAWCYLGKIVQQLRLKRLCCWQPTSRQLEKLGEGMNGTHLDHFTIDASSCSEYNEWKFPIAGLLKLLPLINEQLVLEEWQYGGEDDEEDLQEQLNDGHLRSLTICLGGKKFLKAPPRRLSPTLAQVEGLEVDETNGNVLLKWKPLSIANVSYYIVVETYDDGKAVEDPIETNETSCQLSFLQSQTEYQFFVWGYTNISISKRVTGIRYETGETNESQHSTEVGTLQYTSEREPATVENRLNRVESMMREMREEITKLKMDKETLKKEIAELKGPEPGTSKPQGGTTMNTNPLPFILPMKTLDDVEENEKLLEERENGTKLVEVLSTAGGTGKVAVWNVMEKLFSNPLAKKYNWEGKKGKKSLRNLKMKEIIYKVCRERNINEGECRKAVVRWLKSAHDRGGGRTLRKKSNEKAGKSGAEQTD